jgi:L-fuconolactonase
MRIIDSHQHFWQYDADQHGWINDSMQVIRRDFMPADLKPLLQHNGVAATVAVQADQSEAETDWLLQLASANDFIAGVVGWVDLRSEQLEERLAHYASFPQLKGFRHILQSEEPAFMLQPAFLRGIGLLQRFGFTYDILIFPHQLEAALQLVRQFPEQPFVIDHLAKPYIKQGLLGEWVHGLRQLAALDHVHCKLSGMVTEADWQRWTAEDLKPYLDGVVEAFGTHRLLFGSDWPVCLVASSYERWLQVVRDYFESFSAEEQAQVFGDNAIRFYNLTD